MIRVSREKILQLMRVKGIEKQADLAKRAQVSVDLVSEICQEAWHDCQPMKAKRLAMALETSVEEIRWSSKDCVVHPYASDKSRPQDEPKTPLRSFQNLIDFHVSDFHGREFVFERIRAFLRDSQHRSGYLVIQGEPGIGKSALLAKWIHEHDCIHYFNIAEEGINTPKEFLRHTCLQLIERFKLPHDRLPDDYAQSGYFLSTVIQEAAKAQTGRQGLVIVVDALDEVRMSPEHAGANALFLPRDLPDGVKCIVTTRAFEETPLSVAHHDFLLIEAQSNENQQDAAAYIRALSQEEGIRRWVKRRKLSETAFVSSILEKSDGNFMYLRLILAALAKPDSIDMSLDELPHGLREYYRAHWAKKRRRAGGRFDELSKSVLCLLAATPEAVRLEHLVQWTQRSAADILEVLAQWMEFLDQPRAKREKRYRLYHSTFREFLEKEIEPGLRPSHEIISTHTIAKLGGTRGLPRVRRR